jgi:tetratricopeptide (TPR) repeat protein
LDEAIKMYEASLKTKIEALGHNHMVDVAGTYVNMANVEQQLGNFEKSIELYEKAPKIYIQSVGPAHLSQAKLLRIGLMFFYPDQ